MLQTDNISVLLNFSLKRPWSLLSCFFCAAHSTFGGRSFWMHQQWNYNYNRLAATNPTLFSMQVGYNIPAYSRQEHDTSNLCPFSTLRISWGHRSKWKGCSILKMFVVLQIHEGRARRWLTFYLQSVLWLVQHPANVYSHDLAFWTVHYC